MRALLATAAMAMLVGVAGVGLAAPAGAQAQQFSCTYSVSPTTLPPGGGTVTVSGTGPGSSVVRIFVDGQLAATTNSNVNGAFSAQVTVTETSEVSVAFDDYPGLVCTAVGGTTTDRPGGPTGVVTGGTTVSRLPRTGTSVGSTVLAGLAAVAVGAVLVVAARRRESVRSHA